MAPLVEIATVALLLILAGIVIAAPGYPIEQRVAGMSAIVALLLAVMRWGRRR